MLADFKIHTPLKWYEGRQTNIYGVKFFTAASMGKHFERFRNFVTREKI